MKKITLIACAALVAGLLVSCNNGAAGTRDLNDVTWTQTEYEYLVSGKVVDTVSSSFKGYDDENKQTYGESSTVVTTEEIVSTPGYVRFGTNANKSTNYENGYTIVWNASQGYKTVEQTEGTQWDISAKKEKDLTAAELDAYTYKVEKADKPTQNVGSGNIFIYKINDEFKIEFDNRLWTVTVDEEKLSSGKDFDLSFEATLDDSTTSANYKDFDADGKEVAENASSSKSTDKSTKKVTLKFTAVGTKVAE